MSVVRLNVELHHLEKHSISTQPKLDNWTETQLLDITNVQPYQNNYTAPHATTHNDFLVINNWPSCYLPILLTSISHGQSPRTLQTMERGSR